MDKSKENQNLLGDNPFIRRNWYLITALILFILLSAIFINFYLYSTIGDAISYINIAKAYANGDFFEAVNGYWSPLFSWLMAPFLLFNTNPLYAVYISKIISLIIGLFTIIGVNKLCNIFKFDLLIKSIFIFSMIPIVLYFALIMNTPDLLVVLILIFYLSFIFDAEYGNKLSFGLFCGLLGGLAYLTKSYLFFFFLIHFTVFNIIFYFKCRNNKKKIFKNFILGIIIFFVISGLWIGIISSKYDKLTISTAGEYNQAIMGPEYSGHHPLYNIGLIQPPGNYATSIWDEPSFTNLNHWNPLISWQNFQYQIQLIIKNIVNTFIILESFFYVSLVILIFSFLFIFKLKSDILARYRVSYLLLTILIYISGYALITVEWRYFWFIFILIMFMGFYLVNLLYKNKSIKNRLRNFLLILLVLSFVVQPTIELISFASADNGVYDLSMTLKNDYGIKGNIASDDNWGEMTTISYYLNTKYYGLTKKNNSVDIQRELEENNIDYYFVWNNNGPIILSDYIEITGGKLQNLRIFMKIG